MVKDVKQRTTRQNSSLHLLLTQLSDDLDDHGKTMMKVLSPAAEIPWTPEAAKNYPLRPFIKAMYNKDSTTKLTTKELSQATEAMLDHVAKTTGVALDFPSLESLQQQTKGERVWR